MEKLYLLLHVLNLFTTRQNKYVNKQHFWIWSKSQYTHF